MKRAVGRPAKVDYRTMTKIADALQHSATISDACRYADVSRETYYRYYRNEPTFAEAMDTARANQHKIVFSSLTLC